MKPEVSVVIATFNGADHLADQLTSVIHQTVKPIEILVGDDGSSDGTLDVLSAIAAHSDVPIAVTENEIRLGFADNFLQTAARARGDLIAFADQDDVWLPGKLAAACDAFASSDTMLWLCGWRVVNADLEPLPDHKFHTGLGQRFALADPMYVPHGSRSVFRREILEHFPAARRTCSVFGAYPAHHDEWVAFGAHVLGRVTSDREPAMLYRRHEAASTGNAVRTPSRSAVLASGHRHANVVEAAIERARFLRDRAGLPSSSSRRRELEVGADYYEQLIPRLRRRTATSGHAQRSRRAIHLLVGATHGDYRRRTRGGFGPWALAQDLNGLR
jgi:glycosyltransferase involved in cell wall biosynthesis